MNSRKASRILALPIAFAVCITSVLVLPLNDVSAASKKKAKKQRTASMTLVKKGNGAFDFRSEAGEKLYGYDTLQGACANAGYAYLTLYNRNVESCKIVKVKLSTREVVKVSSPLPVYHANCLTYNTRKNLLVATCCRVMDKRAVFIDPNTLTVTSYKDIQLTKKVKRLPKSVRRKYKGFTAIAYNSQKDCYVGRLRSNNNVIIFDGNLNPKKYVVLKGKQTALLNQGMDSVGNYIYDVRSFKGKKKYSMVTVHTMSGKLVGKVKFPYGPAPGNELQCIFHDGRQFYAGFYYTTSQAHDYASYHVNRTNTLYYLNNMYR
ncbi:MAG: hypothetical protein J6D57_07325 [Mogibacterium sp.]|nr:hypothetical protein [Mogibacterium sp.]